MIKQDLTFKFVLSLRNGIKCRLSRNCSSASSTNLRVYHTALQSLRTLDKDTVCQSGDLIKMPVEVYVCPQQETIQSFIAQQNIMIPVIGKQ